MIECIRVKNIKTKITVNVNIFIVVLMNCISPWVGWFCFGFFFLSKLCKLDVKNTKAESLNRFDKVIESDKPLRGLC